MLRAVAATVLVAATVGFPAAEVIAAHSAYAEQPHSTADAHAPPSGCYPQTKKGNCYEPGEFCRRSDHGAFGVAGDGESIECSDNDGWRWEPISA
jgi:hypothetical protein